MDHMCELQFYIFMLTLDESTGKNEETKISIRVNQGSLWHTHTHTHLYVLKHHATVTHTIGRKILDSLIVCILNLRLDLIFV